MKYNIGDIIHFQGNMHYESSDSNKGKLCNAGLAKVNMINANTLHPYHIIAEPCDKASVYGWVNENDVIIMSTDEAIDRLTYINVINSPDYWKSILKANIVPYLDQLFINSCMKITNINNINIDLFTAIDRLITAKVINTPEYWQKQAIKYSNITALLIKLGQAVNLPKNNGDNLRNKVVSIAQSFLGYNEWDGSHQIIIDTYNKQKPLPMGYAMRYNDSWCQCFVTVVFIKTGLKHLIYPECSCQRAIDGYINTGIGTWVEDDSYMPSTGDIIYYNWDDGWDYTYNDNQLFADHVGIVVSCDGQKILVIEGNYQDQVKYRTIDVNGKFIRGFFVPKYN